VSRDLYVEEHGEGETLLLHQGLGQGSWAWMYTAPTFAARFRTITFDTRGTGRSPVPDAPYDIHDLADDAARVLDGRRAHVAGFSMGGYVALTLALAHPELVRKLVLAGTGAGGPGRVPRPAHVREAFEAALRLPAEQPGAPRSRTRSPPAGPRRIPNASRRSSPHRSSTRRRCARSKRTPQRATPSTTKASRSSASRRPPS
jgi:pimeloyl-ACP methyl ester carboxylesterase